MSLYRKTPNGPWYYDFVVNGKRFRASTELKDWEKARGIEVDLEAKEREKARREELGLKPAPEPEPEPARVPTVGELVDGLQGYYKLHGKANDKNLSLLKRIRRDLGDTLASHMTKAAVLRYLAKRQGAANSTLNHAMQVLSSAFKLAELPFPEIKKLSEKKAVRSGFFEDDEFRRIYHHLPEDLADFALFGFVTGWRKGAISTLTWDSVSNGNVYLKAMHSKNGLAYFVPAIPGSELDELLKRRRAARLVDGVLSNLVSCPIWCSTATESRSGASAARGRRLASWPEYRGSCFTISGARPRATFGKAASRSRLRCGLSGLPRPAYTSAMRLWRKMRCATRCGKCPRGRRRNGGRWWP
jgi:hypothetical protein